MNKVVSKTFLNLLKEYEKGEITFDCKDGVPFVFRLKLNYQIHTKDKIYTNKKVDDIPTLVIKDYPSFIDLLEKSLKIRKDFHKNDLPELTDDDYLKYLISFTFVNMTALDFLNPTKYLQDLTNSYLLENRLGTTANLGNITLDKDYQLFLIVKKEKLGLEAPYSYTYLLKNSKENYYFPSIFAVKNEDTLEVRAIQKKFSSDKSIEEEVNSYIKDNIQKEGLNNKKLSYLRNVNPSFVVALNMFIQQNKENINYVEFPMFSPLRYINKERTLLFKVNKYKNNVALYEEKLKEANQYLDNVQEHITNKLIYTALRMQHHLPEYQILDYGEIGEKLKLKIDNKKDVNEFFDKFTTPFNKVMNNEK